MEFGFEVEGGLFEGGTHFGAVGSEDAEGGLVPDDLPGRMGMQEMVMAAAQQDTVGVAGLTAVLPMLHVMGFTPSGWDLTPRPPAMPVASCDLSP